MRWVSLLVIAALLSSPRFAFAQDEPPPPEKKKPAADPSAQPSQQPQQQPPPGYGQPPPPGYGYPPPAGYYVVPYYAQEPPPPWKPGQPAPAGYHVETKADGKTIRSGVGLLVALWICSVLTGAVLNESEEPKSEDGDDVEPGDWTPMYYPILGPFLAMKNLDSSDGGWAVLLLDGIGQSAGALMIVIGLVNRKEYLEANSTAKAGPRFMAAPFIGRRGGGFGISGTF